MRCFLFWSNLLLSFAFGPFAFGLRITIDEGGGIVLNRPTTVRWSHEPSDPPNFDFRFVVGQFNDVGLAAANIAIASPGGAGQSGEVQVIFPRPGRFVIKAVSGPQFSVIGTSNEVEVRAAVTSAPTTASRTSSTTPSTSSTPAPDSRSSSTSPSTRSGVIAGIVIGTLALIIVLAMLLFFFLRRRRALRKEEQRVSFHPEQMVQRRSRFLSIGRLTFRSAGSASGGVGGDPEQGRGQSQGLGGQVRREGSTGAGVITPFPLPSGVGSTSAGSPPPPASTSMGSPSPPASASIFRPGNPFIVPGEPALRPLPTPPPAVPVSVPPTPGLVRAPSTPRSVPIPATPVPAPVHAPPTPAPVMSEGPASTHTDMRQSVLRPLPHLPPSLSLSQSPALAKHMDMESPNLGSPAPAPPLLRSPSVLPVLPAAESSSSVEGQTRALPPVPATSTTVPTTSTTLPSMRTERQHHLASRLVQVQDQIRALELNPEKLEQVLAELYRQVLWLEENVDGPWARGETDETPAGFARYA